MARRPASSPTAVAIQRVASLAEAGTSPAGMRRDTRAIVGEWRAQQEPDIARRWIGELHADLSASLATAKEQAIVDAGAVKQGRAVMAALQAACDLLTKELTRH